MSGAAPEWLDPGPWVAGALRAGPAAVRAAVTCDQPGVRELALLLSPAAAGLIEPMARRAQDLTRRHFGRTISLYAPLYLSDYCPGGCRYCGFAADRDQPRRRLELDAVARELAALRALGLDDVLLLTGERCPEAGFDYLHDGVRLAAGTCDAVAVETFPMSADEYRALAAAGCTSMTLYQETYQEEEYAALHRWGPKRDFLDRIAAPARAAEAGLRTIGLGVLLGLADPLADLVALYQHGTWLRRRYWRTGISLSFPRIQAQRGDFSAPHPVSEAYLAQAVFAFRICWPDVPLVLSTREAPAFRDGMAGLGISRMSVASKTTVGGYAQAVPDAVGQFEVSDTRGPDEFCAMLRGRGLEPVFKNWDAVYR